MLHFNLTEEKFLGVPCVSNYCIHSLAQGSVQCGMFVICKNVYIHIWAQNTCSNGCEFAYSYIISLNYHILLM